jgi:DNA mismatch repair protein MSH5
MRPSIEFAYESGKSKILNLDIGFDNGPRVYLVVPGDLSARDGFPSDNDGNLPGRQGRLLHLSGWMDVESRLTVSHPPFLND